MTSISAYRLVHIFNGVVEFSLTALFMVTEMYNAHEKYSKRYPNLNDSNGKNWILIISELFSPFRPFMQAARILWC